MEIYNTNDRLENNQSVEQENMALNQLFYQCLDGSLVRHPRDCREGLSNEESWLPEMELVGDNMREDRRPIQEDYMQEFDLAGRTDRSSGRRIITDERDALVERLNS